MEERKTLICKIYEQDKKCEELKARYTWGIILLYFLFNLIVLYVVFMYNKPFDFWGFGTMCLVAAVLSAISYWVNFSIFHTSFHKIDTENRKLKELVARLEEFDKEHNIDMWNTVENRIINGHM